MVEIDQVPAASEVMKAFAQNGYRSADVYELVDVARPVPSANEVLVKVIASAVNDWEWGMLRAPWMVRLFIGLLRPRGKFHVMGCDIAELALQAIQSARELKAGQEVLVNGAAGGVGTLAIQLLKRLDLEVTGVDRAAKLERLRELGYDHVVAWPEEDFTRRGKRYDLIIDVKTSAPAYAYSRALKPAGVYSTVGGDKVFSFMLLAPLISLFTRKRLKAVMLKPNRNLEEISELFGRAALKPVIDQIFAFSDLRQALTRFRDAQHVGKIVIRMP
jgi:NADPH:quinone reductase-like Zn-dependent oxidoreductase